MAVSQYNACKITKTCFFNNAWHRLFDTGVLWHQLHCVYQAAAGFANTCMLKITNIVLGTGFRLCKTISQLGTLSHSIFHVYPGNLLISADYLYGRLHVCSWRKDDTSWRNELFIADFSFETSNVADGEVVQLSHVQQANGHEKPLHTNCLLSMSII